MGIFGALNTSVAGLRAQSFALENISGNIANSQTTAFKRIDTSFEDLIPDAGVNNQLAGSVTTQSRETNTVRGDIQPAATATFVAISGSGFFVTQKPSSFSDNQPIFSGVNNYTRRGDFSVNKDGFLVNAAGYYLEGLPIDATTGNVTGSVPQVLKFSNSFLPAQPTTAITYHANLASLPFTAKHDPNLPGSELLNPADFPPGSNPVTAGTPAVPPGNSSRTGAAENNKQTTTPPTPITAATKLTGAANTDSIAQNFARNDTIQINVGGVTKTIKFFDSVAGDTDPTSATAPVTVGLDLNGGAATVDDLLRTIDVANGNPHPGGNASSVNATGQVILNSGTANDLKITGTSNATALGAIGITIPGTPQGLVVQRTGGGGAGTGQVLGNDVTNFVSETVSGGAITVFDTSGSQVSVQLRWGKTDSATLGPGHTDTWNLFYQTNSNATGAQVAWQNVNQDFRFGPNGQQTPPPGIASVTLNSPTINGVTLGPIAVNFGSGGITQFADANGAVQVSQIAQDGFSAGELDTISVGDGGKIIGNFSNGRNVDLAQISVVNFNGADFLKRLDGGAFEETDESGPPVATDGADIKGASLESSNVDIADEFTKLIVTQQAYSANTRVITTTNTMVQDLLNVIR
jgi:flagellar hook protein FlgE